MHSAEREPIEHDYVRAARTEVARMRQAIAAAGPDARVSMAAGQFATVAELIERLCALVPTRHRDSMAADGHWVPLAEYQRLRRMLGERQRELTDLRARSDIDALIAADRLMEWRSRADDADQTGRFD